MRKIGHGLRVGNIVALDQVPEQDGVEIFLMNPDPQRSVQSGDLREAAGLPIFLEGLLYEESLLRRHGARAFGSLIGQELPKREREQLS